MVKEKSAALSIAAIGIFIIAIAALDQILRTDPPSREGIFLAGVMVMGAGLLVYAFLDQRAKLKKMRAMGAKLRRSEARFRSLVTSQGDVIVRCDTQGQLTFVNDIFCTTFGLYEEAVLGRPFYPETQTNEADNKENSWCFLPDNAERHRTDQFIKTATGWRWFAWERCAIRNQHGDLIEVQSIGRDVTHRKELEEQLDEARIGADKANRAKSRFLATMSHEIRTPMNGILGMTGLLLESELSPDQQTYASAIQQSGEGLLTLINDILDYSKIESGKIGLNPIGVDIRFMVERMAELLAPRAFEKGIDFAVHVAPDVPPLVLADEGRLRQVLFNLVGNALKFTTEGGVSVHITREPNANDSKVKLRFTVRDTGPGIAPEDQDRLFEEFEQGELSPEQAQGSTGLGLAISKRIIEAMGGEIDVDSVHGDGARFWFQIVLPSVNDGRKGISVDVLNGHDVLLVSTRPITTDGLERDLRAMGATITNAETEDDAIAKITERAGQGSCFSAIICDGEAAPNTGTLVCDHAEKEALAHDFAVPRRLILLPLGDQSKLTAVDEFGFDGYLLKPVRQRSLISQLQHNTPVESGRLDKPMFHEAPSTDDQATPIRILLAEDNQVNALLAKTLLAREGHVVETAENGIEVLAAIEAAEFDIILMDIHMPKMDGLEATRQIRSGRHAALPIVALTANAMMEDQTRCEAAGMDDYLSKPVDPDRLSEKVQYWANKERDAAPQEDGPLEDSTLEGATLEDATLEDAIPADGDADDDLGNAPPLSAQA